MLTYEEKEIIKKFVDPNHFNQEGLISYLEMHDVVGPDVFTCCKNSKSSDGKWYCESLKRQAISGPMSVSGFAKRVPFYFFGGCEHYNIIWLLNTIATKNHFYKSDKNEDEYVERIFAEIEFAYYNLGLPLERIFSYWDEQVSHQELREHSFVMWAHYLHLCYETDCKEYFPDCFIAAYNDRLEAVGLPPIIYEVDVLDEEGSLMERCGDTISFFGYFPFDEEGFPILKWIAIRATHVEPVRSDSRSKRKSDYGSLTLKITPKSLVHVAHTSTDRNDNTITRWYQVYAGAQTMKFDHTVIKEKRKRLGYSQEFVAEAIETSVRTYQKWESGETTPNGHFLLRLLNILDIESVQDITEYTDCKR